jgi:predicted permease
MWYWREALLLAAGFAVERALETTNRRGGSMEAWARDLRVAARTLLRRPGFAAVAVLTLALGIGANTAIFSVLYGALLAPLPYPEPDRLVWLSDARKGGWTGNSQSIPNLLDLGEQSTTLAELAIYGYASVNFAGDGEAERLQAMLVSPEFFRVLGAPPRLGRDFAPEENHVDAAPVVILGHALWQERFGGDPAVVGRTVVLNATPYTVIGVASPDLELHRTPAAFTLFRWDPANLSRGSRSYNAMARLVPGVTVDAADAELKGLFARLESEYPEPNAEWTVDAIPLRSWMIGRDGGRQVLLLAGAALLVLLIACVNVANLLLARAESRSREIAVRGALGAGRGRIVRLFLGESVLLAVVGGFLGVGLAYWGVNLLTATFASSLPRGATGAALGLSLPAVLFALATALATGVFIGLVPALRARLGDLYDGLREGGRGALGAATGLRRALVVAEVALAMTLVAGAGLLLRSFWAVSSIDVGLEAPERVLTFQLSPPSVAYPDRTAVAGFYGSLAGRLEALPGVESVGFTNRAPLDGGTNLTDVASGENPDVMSHFVEIRTVNPGFFEAAGIPLVAGRTFEPGDAREDFDGVVITRELGRQLFGDEDPLGRTIHAVSWGDFRPTVIGVAEDTRDMGPTRAPPPGFYLPLGGPWVVNSLVALVRTRGNPLDVAPAVREQLRALDAALPLYDVRLLSDVVSQRAGGGRRLSLTLVLIFGGVALVLGAVGIYGVMSFVVAARTREMGVRIALGAGRGDVSRLVMRQGIRLTALGIALGVGGALASSRFLESLLYEVRPSDPLTHGAVAALLTAVALLASWLPARRASHVDPLEALREA